MKRVPFGPSTDDLFGAPTPGEEAAPAERRAPRKTGSPAAERSAEREGDSPATERRTAHTAESPPAQPRGARPTDSTAAQRRLARSEDPAAEGPHAPAAAAGAAPQRSVYSVTQLNREVRMLLERGLPMVWLEGELSNFSAPGSGHWYFSLKDREAQIRCAMFRMKNTAVGFTPKSGQHVLVRGRVTMYEARGDYQLIVEHLEEAGVGALKREFERLKAKLHEEGLFAVERKRELPRFPRCIGVVTSPTGAAIRDILHILARRFPPAAVIIYPAPVQGAAAIPGVIRALQIANARAECDVLIVARGGGSLEDLWAFNDEGVARAIHASKLPVVSGVGHEVDFTIADFVADARAPTPSGAAELVVPDRVACLDVLGRTADRLVVAMRREMRMVSTRFDAAAQRLNRMHPGTRLLQQEQRLDDLEQRLTLAMRGELRAFSSRADAAAMRLKMASPEARLTQQQRRLVELSQRLGSSMRARLQDQRHRLSEARTHLLQASPERRVQELHAKSERLTARLAHAMSAGVARAEHRLLLATRTLHAVSPLATLDRGFAIVKRSADGAVVTDVASLQVGDEIEARVARGTLRARVTGKGEGEG